MELNFLNKEHINDCSKIFSYYQNKEKGSQLSILQEECAELITAASKVRRNNFAITENFIEECADVTIMLIQHICSFSEEQTDEFHKNIENKIRRQLRRVSEDCNCRKEN